MNKLRKKVTHPDDLVEGQCYLIYWHYEDVCVMSRVMFVDMSVLGIDLMLNFKGDFSIAWSQVYKVRRMT